MIDPMAAHPGLERLRGLQYDLFQRYATLVRVLVALFPGDRAVRLLDIGSGPSPLSTTFLPARFGVTRADVEEFGDPAIVRLTPGAPLPFADRSFDAVIAIDVLEHVPPAMRAALVGELGRVAAEACVLTFPSGDDARTGIAESAYGAVFSAAFGSEIDFLREHREYGLPRAQEVAAALGGLTSLVLPNAALDEWLLWNSIDALLCARFGDGVEKAAFNAAANRLSDGPVEGVSHYRQVLVAVRESTRLDAVGGCEAVRPRPATLAEFAELALPVLRMLETKARRGAAEGLGAKDAHIRALQQMADDLAAGLRLKDAHIEALQRLLDEQTGAARARSSTSRPKAKGADA